MKEHPFAPESPGCVRFACYSAGLTCTFTLPQNVGPQKEMYLLTFSQSLHTSVLFPLVTIGLSAVNRKFCLWNKSEMCERGKWNAHKVTQSSFQLMNTMKKSVVRISWKNLPNIDRNQKKSIMKFIILRPPSTSPVGCI